MTGFVLGVDLGTGGPRVALAGTDGVLVGHAKEPVDLRLLPGGGAEQDPDHWWRAIVTASRRLRARHPQQYAQVTAICMSSQWGGLVPVDAAGRHVHPALTWMDARGRRWSEEVTGGGVRVPGGYNARALRHWLSRTGGVPTRTGKDPVGQAAWLRRERPEADAAAVFLLDVPEYLTMRLTGRAVAGWDTAVLRWCTDNRDPSDVRWDAALARRCGLDVGRLPELVRPGTVVGTALPAVALELGLPGGVRVVAGTGDTTAAAVGAGATADFDAHLYVGTSAWLSCHVPYKRTDIVHNIASLPSVVPDRYWVATVQDVAGKAVDWLLDSVVYAQDGMLDAAPRPADALERLNALAAAAPPGCNGVVFTPWLNGERTPVDDPHVRGGWFNVSLSTTRADLARSVFEGIALNARWMLEAVERFTRRGRPEAVERFTRRGRPEAVERFTRRGRPETFSSLRFIGGGASSALWCQTMADVLGMPVRQVADPVVANARGAALIAAIGVGALDWADVPSRVEVAATFVPDPAVRAVHDRQYAAFRDIYRRTHGLYARHNAAGAIAER
ncbi:FGGY-family carbohydrate kinase [Fodinibacter luteus]|uniref:FGGY-family carbohydrate kinase n=1 Tax=Fodinibacter luteus TaxID=552064 RepID=A0ABP8KDQ7_9MICO